MLIKTTGSHSFSDPGQQLVAQLPWGHNVLLLTKLKDPAAHLRYAEQAVAA